MSEEKRVKVGVGVMVMRGGKLLLARRKYSYGDGEYACPGGHLEFGESIASCARRETKEEAGIEIKNLKFLLVANMVGEAGKHYLHITMLADYKSGKPQNLEPEKQGSWAWHDLKNLPKPLFWPIPISVEALRSGKIFFDSK